jgi:hypothetical protein
MTSKIDAIGVSLAFLDVKVPAPAQKRGPAPPGRLTSPLPASICAPIRTRLGLDTP